ncbi:hypothetical protein Tco_0691571 [Tanacetum coccineum]
MGMKSVLIEAKTWQENQLFDEIPEDTLDYMETEDAQDVGRTRDVVDEEKENAEDDLLLEDYCSTAQHLSYLKRGQAKAVSREKEKGVEFKDIEETERPRPTSTRSLLTLNPLPKIDPKDKGKNKIEEEYYSEKCNQMKVQEEWEGDEERKRLAKEEATNNALIRNYDDIKARIEADRLLAEKLQEEEREQFTIEERAKFLHDTIVAQRKFLSQQRSKAIRNRPPTKNQLRNQMMTYLKHVGNFKHSDLKTKKFEEIQALYEKIKRSDEDFIFIGSAEDMKVTDKKDDGKRLDSSKNESARLNKVSSPDGDYLVIYRANGNFRAFNYLMEVLHIFDRQDLFTSLYLNEEQYSKSYPLEGFAYDSFGET